MLTTDTVIENETLNFPPIQLSYSMSGLAAKHHTFVNVVRKFKEVLKCDCNDAHVVVN